MSRIVTDTFTDTSGVDLNTHTPDVGSTPSRHTSFGSSALKISGTNDCYHSDSNTALYYYPDTPGAAEYDVVVDMTRITTVANETMGPAGRIDTSANTVYFARYSQANTRWELFKTVAGTSTSLGTSSQTLTNGVTYNCKLEIRDAAKKVYIDAVSVISSADNAITATGKCGLRNSGSTAAGDATGMHIDNLAVDDTVSAGAFIPIIGRGPGMALVGAGGLVG